MTKQFTARRAGIAALTTVALLCAATPASAADFSDTLAGDDSTSWSGNGNGAYLLYPLFGCGGKTLIDNCHTALITATPSPDGPSTLSFSMTPRNASDDFDLSVYVDANADGTPDADDPIDDGRDKTGLGAGDAESLVVPNAAGTYLVEINFFTSIQGGFDATATLDGP